VSKRKEKAAKILARAKAGEDFAALANEFTEDPGNTQPNGTKAGGIYRDVPKGMMIGEFEKAALALNPGGVSPDLVETEFGYHIIKLEKKGEVKKADGTTEFKYDVRHILISTGYKDPANPGARDVPVKEFVRSKLESENERLIVDKLVKDNMIVIAAFPTADEMVTKPPVKKRPVKRGH
jgi:parvulin-like peptidyl-prolyl isomerase